MLDLVAEVQAEQEAALRKHQEEDYLLIAIQHHHSDVTPEWKGPDELRNPIVREQVEHSVQQELYYDNEDQVKGEVEPAVVQ